jgi:protein disulfide-isomerase A4
MVVVYYDVDFSFDGRVQTQLVRKRVLKAAQKYAGKITFAISNEADYADEIKDLGLDDSGEDVNIGFFKSLKERFALEPNDDVDSEVITEFVESVLAGEVKPSIKSQIVPAVNDGPVKIVVGSTFEDIVVKSPKNVLIEFYAPWCGHCKTLEPVYKQLAFEFSDHANTLTIAKLDATANDYPEKYDVSGFPTLYFIPANAKDSPHHYVGDRSLADLTKYLNQMLDHEFSKADSKDEL